MFTIKIVLKYIYLIIPFKKQLFILIRFFLRPSERVFKHLHFKAVIKVKVLDNTFFNIHHAGNQIENELFWLGIENAWEKKSMNLWIELSKISITIFDIGAYSGIYSLTSASVNKNANIHAFEPMKNNFELFIKNININNFHNIFPTMKACSNYNGTANVFTKKNNIYPTSVTVNKSLLAPTTIADKIEIDVLKIKDYFNENHLESLDLLKIDVETHEPEVLEGMEDLIDKFKPTMLIEILNDDVANRLMEMLEGKNYLYFDIDEKNGVNQMQKLKKSSTFNYLICQKEIAQKLNLI